MSPAKPGRILHCDMDCFYAAVHMRDDPSLVGKPVVIGGSPEGRGVVAAASYEARAFGIHSAMPAARALRLCPEAIFIRPRFSLYRRESREIFAIFAEFTSRIQQVSIDEAYLDLGEDPARWGSATEAAREIKRRVRERRGLTVSIGVGPNRLIAKIASDCDKPDGLTVVPPERVQAFLDPLPVRRLPGVGPATAQRLVRLGVERIAQLRALPIDQLLSHFGRHGRSLYERARGIDPRPVRTIRVRKSVSSERTFPSDLETLEDMDGEIDGLAGSVASTLAGKGLAACTLTVKVRYGDFTTVTRSRTLDSPTASATVIASYSKRLLRSSAAGSRTVRLLGVGASNLVRGAGEQLELFDLDGSGDGPTGRAGDRGGASPSWSAAPDPARVRRQGVGSDGRGGPAPASED